MGRTSVSFWKETPADLEAEGGSNGKTQILGERQGGNTVGGMCEGIWLANSTWSGDSA